MNQRPEIRLKGKEYSLSLPQRRFDQPQVSIGHTINGLNRVFLAQERPFHTHIIGATGKGKSKFLELLIRNDMHNPNVGLCVIDPTGRLYRDVLLYASHCCKKIADRFILMDFTGENGFITGFNPISKNPKLSYDSKMLMSAIQKAWGQSDSTDTPTLTRWLPDIIALIILNNLTLMESMHVADASQDGSIFRAALLKNCSDPFLLKEWQEFETLTPVEKRTALLAPRNRLSLFLSDETIRKIICQQTHSLDFKKILDQGKILLVNLNGKTEVFNQFTSLIGILLIHEIVRVAESRNDDDPGVKPFYLYIDEFGQLVTDQVAKALDVVRKRKLFFILAHQHFSQLDDEKTPRLKSSILTNCQVKICFGGLNVEDAKYMSDLLFTGHRDLKKVKHILKSPVFEPILTQRETSSTTESHSEEFSEGEAIQHGENTERGISRSAFSDGFFDKDRKINETTGTKDSVNRSSGHSHGNSSSVTRGLQWVTDHKKYDIVSSIQYYSLEELKEMNSGLLMNLARKHAVIKAEETEPVELEIADVETPIVSKFTQNFLPEFKSKSFLGNQDCCIALENTDHDFFERDKKVQELLDSLQIKPQPLLDEPDESNPKPKRRKPPRRPKDPTDDSPFEC